MKHSITCLAAAATIALAAPACYAADFGMALSNDSLFSMDASDSGYTTVERARAWVSIPLGADASIYCSGFYEYQASTDGAIPLRLDFDLTELVGSVNEVIGPTSVLRYAIGRTPFIDFSGRVISGLSDGLSGELAIGNVSIQLHGGYRGLLYKQDALSFLDAADRTDYLDSTTYFAPNRAFTGLGIRFIELLPNHDFGVEGWGQFDFSDASGKTDTQYVEPFIEGRLGKLLRWRAWNITEFGNDGAEFMAMSAGGQVRLSLPELGLHITPSLTWASGAAGPFQAFTPIRQGTMATVSLYPFSDAFSFDLDADVTLLRALSLGVFSAAIFRASDNSPAGGGPQVGRFGQLPRLRGRLPTCGQPDLGFRDLGLRRYFPSERRYSLSDRHSASMGAQPFGEFFHIRNDTMKKHFLIAVALLGIWASPIARPYSSKPNL